jgi:hypothetical protein
MNAAFGAMSILAKLNLPNRKKILKGREGESGMSERKIAEGRCVKTMVLIGPMRLQSEAATRVLRVERSAAIEKRVPRVWGVSKNLVEKK